MIRWFQDNPVGIGLASVCSLLIFMALLLAVIRTLPPSAPNVDTSDGEGISSLDLPELRAAGPIEEYAEIISRPVFNESRQPILDLDEDDGMEDDALEEEVDAPDVVLAGVVITPSLRMATLREKGQPTSLVAFEGLPLEGNYGGWQISRIEPREVTLTSGDGEELQLKLQVHNATIVAPPKAQPQDNKEKALADEGTSAGEEGDQPLSRAEEIRQRIAERREELRRAAESESESETDAPNTEMTYQQAIQSMMGKKRQEKANNDQKE